MSDIVKGLGGIVTSIAEIIKGIFTTIFGIFEGAISTVIGLFQGVINLVFDLFRGLFNATEGIVGFILGNIFIIGALAALAFVFLVFQRQGGAAGVKKRV